MTRTCVFLLLLLNFPSTSMAGAKSKLVREAAEHLVGRFGREVAGETVETLVEKIGRYGLKYGDEAIEAIRKTGPRGFKLLDEAGDNAPAVASLLTRYGNEAVWVVSKPRNLAIFVRHGDDAVQAMIKHPGIAESVIEKLGQPAARAMHSVTPQNARRIAMMADDGILATANKAEEFLAVISKYGDSAAEFIWKHKGALAITTVGAAFLADPQAFLDGTRDIAEIAVRPIDSAAREFTKGVAEGANWTVVILALVSIGILLILAVSQIYRRGGRDANNSSRS